MTAPTLHCGYQDLTCPRSDLRLPGVRMDSACFITHIPPGPAMTWLPDSIVAKVHPATDLDQPTVYSDHSVAAYIADAARFCIDRARAYLAGSDDWRIFPDIEPPDEVYGGQYGPRRAQLVRDLCNRIEYLARREWGVNCHAAPYHWAKITTYAVARDEGETLQWARDYWGLTPLMRRVHWLHCYYAGKRGHDEHRTYTNCTAQIRHLHAAGRLPQEAWCAFWLNGMEPDRMAEGFRGVQRAMADLAHLPVQWHVLLCANWGRLKEGRLVDSVETKMDAQRLGPEAVAEVLSRDWAELVAGPFEATFGEVAE